MLYNSYKYLVYALKEIVIYYFGKIATIAKIVYVYLLYKFLLPSHF